AHTILEDSVMVVPDATKDQRFFDNPMVIGKMHVRFYAGAPLVSREGHNLGTLCIVDTMPREFSAEDCKSLKDLASMVSDELNVFVDDLTGLANRRGFNIAVDNALNNASYGTRDAALVMFDLDQFKNINDRYGHSAGDEALRSFAGLMTEVFRKSDVVCRLGGDEFCVLLANATESIARRRIELLRKTVREANRKSNWPYKLKFSAGVCSMTNRVGQMSINDIIENADRKLYMSKARKKAVATESRVN
ncbi:MAG: sensor domain-containing diguanylate cyclase, partial [Gammaproteobacteria bacterium]|nr:sensor domain-containing diguanylate cyclase [Gammaproteobacteria bacterium]